MKRTALFASLSFVFVACNLSQDLGGGSDDAGTSDSGPSATGSVANPDASSTSADASQDASVDAKADVVNVVAPCPSTAGYPAAPYMDFTVVGGTFAGTHDTSLPQGALEKAYVSAGHYVSTTPEQSDYTNHFLVNAYLPNHIENGQFVGPEWNLAILTEETTPVLTVGMTYPVTVRPGFLFNGGPGDAPKGAQTVAEDKLARYPGTGPGSCSMTVDFQQVGTTGVRACMNARFSCTGLVGKTSGEPISLTGKFSYAGGPK